MNNEKIGMFDSLQPKTAFVFGLVTGIAIMSLLVSFGVLDASANASGVATNTKANTVAVNNAPTANPPAAQPTAGEVPTVTDEDHIRGDKNAPVTFIEYSDFECPFCKKFAPTVDKILEEYDGGVRVVYRHFPLSFHANAQKEAEASECANELGGNDAFWEFHDAIFERTTANGTGFALSALTPLAEELGLNGKKFQECLDSGKYASHVQADMSGGQAAGISGTPGSIIIDAKGNAQLVSGAVPYESIKVILDAALTK